MAEHQVMSWLPKHHSHKRDFVSHPNLRVHLDKATSAAFGLIENHQAPEEIALSYSETHLLTLAGSRSDRERNHRG